jgi:hypothetical protein
LDGFGKPLPQISGRKTMSRLLEERELTPEGPIAWPPRAGRHSVMENLAE